MDPADSILALEAALRRHAPGSSDRAWTLYELAKAHQNRYSSRGYDADLDSARDLYLEATAIELDLSKKARYLNNLGLIYQLRFHRDGHGVDLAAFVEYTQQATCSISDELRPAVLKNYADALQERYHYAGDGEDLKRCITILRDTMKLPAAVTVKPKICNNLCNALIAEFQANEDPSALAEACALGYEAVSSTDDQNPMRAIFLDTYANALYVRSTTTITSAQDLDEAISLGETAVSLAEDYGLQELPNCRLNLGGSFASRFKISRDARDLENSIELFDSTGELMGAGHPHYWKLLVKKSTVFRMRFEEYGSEDDLNHSISTSSEAALKSTGNQLRAQAQDAFGNALLRKYELTGSPDVLDESVLMYKHAVERASNSPDAIDIWHNLGAALQARFELRGSLQDLDEALNAAERSLGLTKKGLPGYDTSLVGLGNVLVRRYERLGIPNALDQAISAYQEALDETATHDRTRAGRLTCLGHALQIRFELSGASDDITDAISYCKESVQISRKEPNYFVCLVNHGNCYLRRYLKKPSHERLGDLTEAIRILQVAADEMPKDAAARVMCLNDLGKAHELRFESESAFDDYSDAARNYQMAMDLQSAPAMMRLFAGYRGAILTWQKDLPKAVMFVQKATKLLPLVSPRILSRSDQQENIATFSGFASYGASILLESGCEAFEAIQTLELSRGVMNSLLLESRIDTSDLQKSNRDLAQEFETLRDQLDSPSALLLKAPGVPIGINLEIERRIATSKRFNQILGEIRLDGNLGEELLGLSKESLESLAGSGSIVTLNISQIRSDALIVTNNRTFGLPLTNLHQEDVLYYAQKYLNTLEDDTPVSRKKTNESLHEMLQWLWDVTVAPILSALDVQEEASEMQRIWWNPIGIMSIFPIHAAGDHSGKTEKSALDRIISSYTTTIRALARSKRNSAEQTPTTTTKAVLVAMATTPGQDDLSFADTEVSHLVSNMVKRQISPVVFRSPAYKPGVLAALQDCNIAQFCCHGIVDIPDPSKSSLLLSDWETSPLTVADINALRLENAQLVYLSACHASSNRALSLLDEGIHLTGAFQMAGFSRAIGTLWQVDDERSVQISEKVWETMMSDGPVLDFGRTAEGLNYAMRSLREQSRRVEGVEMQFPDQPIIWAPFIHMGI